MSRFQTYSWRTTRTFAPVLNTGQVREREDEPAQPVLRPRSAPPKVTAELLASVSTRGRYAVARLLNDPQGTRGLICGTTADGRLRLFVPGGFRFVDRSEIEIVGRAG